MSEENNITIKVEAFHSASFFSYPLLENTFLLFNLIDLPYQYEQKSNILEFYEN